MVTTDIDPFADELAADPYPAYREIAELGRAVWCPPRGCWLVTHYADVRDALADTERFSSEHGIGERRIDSPSQPSLLTADPPEHGPLRRVMAGVLGAGTSGDLEGRLTATCRDLLAGLAGRGSFDLVTDFAGLLPLITIAEIVGMPLERAVRLTGAVATISRSVDVRGCERDAPLEMRVAYDQAKAVASDLIADPRCDSPALAALRQGILAGSLSHQDAVDNVVLLFNAGVDTTANLIANAVLAIGRAGLHLGDVIDRHGAASVVEEALRIDPPLQGAFREVRADDVVLGDRHLPRGSRVCLLIAAANHDPQRFSDPAEFRPERAPNPHLAFARGAHHCLGAALARFESRIALAELAHAMPDLAADLAEEPPRTTQRILRGPQRLVVTGNPRATTPHRVMVDRHGATDDDCRAGGRGRRRDHHRRRRG